MRFKPGLVWIASLMLLSCQARGPTSPSPIAIAPSPQLTSSPPAPSLPPATLPTFLPQRLCTVMGCGPSIQLKLAGPVPPDFVVNATTPTGEIVRVHCQQNKTELDPQTTPPADAICTPNAILFISFTPQNVTITIEWGDREVSQQFQPTYTVSYPNGATCKPQCQSATVELTFPDQ
jgi:hypothetical protein